VSQYCRQTEPRLLLMNQSFDSRAVAPRLARRMRGSIVMNAVGVAAGLELARGGDHLEITTAACGGDTRTTYELRGPGAAIVCLADNACEPEPAEAPSTPRVREIVVDLANVHERIRVVERPHTEGPKLEDAEIIVAGGRGLGEAANFALVEDLARALGGVAAASRPIVDDGWAKPAQQVGLTGKITKPVLYVAAGISGASQHMVGCAAAKTLVAINTDRDAAIFRYARYGIVGDCREMLPAIAQAIASSRGR
jgi:electron transfer flavoprotein alpha subunit